MKVEILSMGPEDNQAPYIKLIGENITDAVALGGLSEKCSNKGISYSSNVGGLKEGTEPYVCLQLVEMSQLEPVNSNDPDEDSE